MLLSGFKNRCKNFLDSCGIFLRKSRGMSYGSDLFLDLERLGFPQDGVIFDVGAHRGETAFLLKERYPSARVFSFEPVSANFEHLMRRVAGLEGVRCFHTALGGSDGRALIHLGSDSQTHRIEGRPDGTGGEVGVEEIDLTTLDAVVASERIERISLLKIDAEGYETRIIDGARATLESRLVDWVFVEATLDPSDTIHTPLATLQAQLGGHDLRLVAVYDQVVWDNPLRLAYVNALFRRSASV